MNFFRLIGWSKSFGKNTAEVDSKIECHCSDSNGFYITKRQASALSSVLIILLTLMLILGYLWGQRNTIQDFSSKVLNDSFADQVNYSMYSMYGENVNSDEEQDESKENSNDIDEIQNGEQQNNKSVEVAKPNESSNIQSESLSATGLKHYAQLIGFGSKRNAEQFVNKLQKKGYNIYIIPRNSRTSKGKIITWYQAVTEKYDDKSKLEEIVNKIKIDEHLNDIKLMTAKN